MEQTPLLTGALGVGFALAGYACGLIPTGPWLTRGLGIDLRHAGSGNVGATNVMRVAGARLGALTLLGDAAKAALPAWIAWLATASAPITAVTATAAVVGHCFPITTGFAGGKGVASALGAVLVLSPATAAIALVAFVVGTKASGYVSVGSLAAAAVAPLAMLLLGAPTTTIRATALMAVVIWIRHRENLARLRAGTESRLSLPKD